MGFADGDVDSPGAPRELTSTGSAQRPRARTIMSAAEGGAADPDFTPVTASRTDVDLLTVLQYWYS